MRKRSRSRRIVYSVLTFVSAAIASTPVSAFDTTIHSEITKESLQRVTVPIDGRPRVFTEFAMEEVAHANVLVDDIPSFSAAIFHPERHFTNEEFVASSQLLIDKKNQIIAALSLPTPDGARARRLLGEALHTIQDFYSHSNWVERGNGAINSNLGRSIVSNPPVLVSACAPDANTLAPGGGNAPTSGYFIDPDPLSGWLTHRDTYGCHAVPAGRCWHGNYTTTCRGMNKDLDEVLAAAHGIAASPFHDTASDLALEATDDFVSQIIERFPGASGERALRALLDLKGDVGFVVDDTGSMGLEILGVQVAIRSIVTFLASAPDILDLAPDRWILSRFGDPDVGPVFITPRAEELLGHVDALFAHAGGDCPELSQEGLLEAVEAASPNSQLFFFSDATAKDAVLGNLVIRRAYAKGIAINYLLTGSCSPADPIYVRGAAETGGLLFFLNPFETSQVLNLVKPRFAESIVRILSDTGVVTAAAPRQTIVPVDASVRRLIVSVSMDLKSSVTLTRPDGSQVSSGQPNVTVTSLSTGALFSVDSPMPGNWSVSSAGVGDVTVVADADSPVGFFRFGFVRENHDIHGGYSAIEGQPVAGRAAMGDAFLVGNAPSNLQFGMVGANGQTLGLINLRRNFPGGVREHFIGAIQPPAQPFQIAATGTDQTGAPFMRLYPPMFRPQSVEVVVEGMPPESVTAGTTTAVTYKVTNLGAASAFNNVAANSLDYAITVTPASTGTLQTGESAIVTARVTVPTTAVAGTPLDISLVSTSTINTTVFNNASVRTIVYRLVVGDVDKDGRVDCTDVRLVKASFGRRVTSTAFDARADLNRDGLVDVRDLAIVTRNLPAGTSCN